MRKVVLTLKGQEKYDVIKKLLLQQKKYATVEDSIFALEEIPEFQAKSLNFDEILPEETKRIYIPRMTHPFKRESFEKFLEKQQTKFEKELEKAS